MKCFSYGVGNIKEEFWSSKKIWGIFPRRLAAGFGGVFPVRTDGQRFPVYLMRREKKMGFVPEVAFGVFDFLRNSEEWRQSGWGEENKVLGISD